MAGINGIMPPIKPIPEVPGASNIKEGNLTSNFGEYLTKALDSVNNLQKDSSQITQDFMTGKIDDLHSVMIAGEKAEVALQFTMQIRNKIMDAYSEIMRMNV